MGDFKGKIHWFDSKKKFGYVVDGYGNEYFYHASGIKKGRQIVLQGFESEDEVEFDLVDGEKGKMATNLVLIKEAPKKPKKKKEKEKAPQGKGVMAIAIEKAMKEKEEKEVAEAETSTTSETPTVEETPVTTEAAEPKAE